MKILSTTLDKDYTYTVSGVKYEFPAGKEVEVPDEVAEYIIEQVHFFVVKEKKEKPIPKVEEVLKEVKKETKKKKPEIKEEVEEAIEG